MPFQKAYEYREKAEGFRRMAREAPDERTRKILNELVAESIAHAEELEALAEHRGPPLQPKVPSRKGSEPR